MLIEPDQETRVSDNHVALRAVSETSPLRLRWSAPPRLSADTEASSVPSVTATVGPGQSLTVRGDGVAHLHGPSLPASRLRFVHQQALILHQLLRGRVVLHGSAVAVDGAAVAVIGPSGAGKSTTAAALLDLGAELLSDDVVVVDDSDGRLTALPTESHLRLRPRPDAQVAADAAVPATPSGPWATDAPAWTGDPARAKALDSTIGGTQPGATWDPSAPRDRTRAATAEASARRQVFMPAARAASPPPQPDAP